jgi:hypothetical protein
MPEEYNWKDYVCDVLLNYENGMICKEPVEKDSNTSMLCTLIGAARMGLGCKDEKHTNILQINGLPRLPKLGKL